MLSEENRRARKGCGAPASAFSEKKFSEDENPNPGCAPSEGHAHSSSLRTFAAFPRFALSHAAFPPEEGSSRPISAYVFSIAFPAYPKPVPPGSGCVQG